MGDRRGFGQSSTLDAVHREAAGEGQGIGTQRGEGHPVATRGQPLGDQPHRVLRAADAPAEVRATARRRRGCSSRPCSGRGSGAARAPRGIEPDPAAVAKRGGGGMSGGPIFLLGIQRGGTNQVLNILRSHPATCWPQGEFHEIFRPRGLRAEGPARLWQKLRRYAPILLTAGDILDPDRPPRRPGLLAGRRGARAPRRGRGLGRRQPRLGRRLQGGARRARPHRPRRRPRPAGDQGDELRPRLRARPARALAGRALRRRHPRRPRGLRGPHRPRRRPGRGDRRLRLRRPPADRARGGRPAAPDLALRGPPRRRPRHRRRDLRASAGSTGRRRAASACRTRNASPRPAAGSPACARSRTTTASRRWDGTCAPTRTRARSRACPRRRRPRSPPAARPVLAHFGYLDGRLPEKAALTGAGPGH